MDPTADVRLGQGHVFPEHVLSDEAQAILVLKEAPLVRPEIRTVAAANDFERRELDSRSLQLALVHADRCRLGFERTTRQQDRERFSDAYRPGAGPPPALHRIERD